VPNLSTPAKETEPGHLHHMVESYVEAKENERKLTMTNNPYYSKVTITIDASNGDMPDYPATNKIALEFDATDANIWAYIDQFRVALRAAGFCEKSIVEALGER
jgi:hypothetical protein